MNIQIISWRTIQERCVMLPITLGDSKAAYCIVQNGLGSINITTYLAVSYGLII